MATDSQMPDSRLPELLPRRRRQHTSITDIDIQQLLTIFGIGPANPNTTFWLLDKEEIVFQPDDIERILKSHNPIARSLSLGSLRAKLRLGTIIGLTLNQARLSEWQYNSHEALQKVESVGSRREIGVNAMYGNEMLRLVGECDHVLRYGREDGTFNFAAVLGGDGSRDEVLGIISIIHHVRKQTWQWDCTVFGLATDGYKFHSVAINNDSQYSWHTLHWNSQFEQVEIISQLTRIMKHAAGLVLPEMAQ